jgi:DNA topoisomerase VI subunit B
MCMPHAPAKIHRPGGWKKRPKTRKKSIPFNEKLMKPDPEFVDERVSKRRESKGWIAKIADWFD